MYLSGMKKLDREENNMVDILIKTSKLKIFNNEEIEIDFQLISNMIICFVDYMKLRAPNSDFKDETVKVKFY